MIILKNILFRSLHHLKNTCSFRKVALIMFFALGFAPLQAQFSRLLKGIDEVEIIAGPSLVSLRGVKFTEYNKTKIGYTIGIGAVWPVRERISIVGKFLVERKGINHSYIVSYFDDAMQERKGTKDEITNLDYLSIPITCRYYLGNKKHFFIEAGPYISYLRKAQYIDMFSWKSKEIYNIKNNFSEFDAGLSWSVGYKIPVNQNISFNFWTTVTFGFVDISYASSASAYSLAKNETWGVGLSLNKKLAR